MALIENSPNADSYLAQFIFSRLPYPLRHAFCRPRNTQNKIACNYNANGNAPTSNSQPPHAMGKLFGTNLRQIISANWALKNLGI